mgnify:CR=1 FL=1
MSFSSVVYRSPDLQHVRFFGNLSLEDAREQYLKGPLVIGFYPGIRTLLDFRGMTGTGMGLADIMSLRDRLIERHCSEGKRFRIALFADNETAYGIARIFETVCSQSEMMDVSLFPSLSEALSFLDLEGSSLASELLQESPRTDVSHSMGS